jgi:hypothetical protein
MGANWLSIQRSGESASGAAELAFSLGSKLLRIGGGLVVEELPHTDTPGEADVRRVAGGAVTPPTTAPPTTAPPTTAP